MPELPEIAIIAQQMNEKTRGKRIACVDDTQPKNLNMPIQEFTKTAKGKVIAAVASKGKWLFVKLDPAYHMLINLGMGAELLYFEPKQKLPEKFQFKLTFTDGTGFTIHFWWFGYVHLVRQRDLPNHKLTAQLGIPPTDKSFTLEHFKALLADKKTGIKSFLLDQKNIAGIGNVYAQDTLFRAKLHPNRKIPTLTEKEINSLYKAIRENLNRSIKRGGAAFELDFYGSKGGFTADDFLVGYKAGKPCPKCGMTIEKIKTGSTSSYICPRCQKLE
ncbi:Fpg/Nei family DNA glycosylase [Candidatus Bathyarchaeota archaeon]|nr:Fpg/Nei family DNA glycosylase [Candidatus Bathyarchaeota archaeon]